MINLESIKLAFFDFDDTLALHSTNYVHEHWYDEGLSNYWLQGYLHPDDFYETLDVSTPSEGLLKVINKLRTVDAKMYCLTGMESSIYMKAKENFVRKYYGSDIEMMSCDKQERKVKVVKLLAVLYNCKPEEILFVDDLQLVVDSMNANGINGVLIGDVDSLV